MHKKLLFVLLALILVGSLSALTCAPKAPAPTPAPAPPPPEKVEEARFALIYPFSGPYGAWGITYQHAFEFWVDKINTEGLLKAGDKTYKLKMMYYDDTGWVPSENLKCLRRAVLEDKVHVVLNSAGVDLQRAIGSFAAENKMLVISWGGGALSPKRPYQLAVDVDWPLNGVLLFQYLGERYPEVQTVASFTPDAPAAPQGLAWREIGAKAMGFDIPFNEIYPVETVDFYPLVTRILAAKPDIIVGDSVPHAQWATVIKTAKELGYKGKFATEQYDIRLVLDKVPAEYVEGMLSSYPECTADDLLAPKDLRDFRAWFDTKYPGEYNPYIPCTMGCLMSWVVGVQLAESIDPTAVRDALLRTDPIQHPLWGECHWGGEEVWGSNVQLFVGCPVISVKNGRPLIAKWYSFADWWAKHKDVALSVLEREGWLWWQEK